MSRLFTASGVTNSGAFGVHFAESRVHLNIIDAVISFQINISPVRRSGGLDSEAKYSSYIAATILSGVVQSDGIFEGLAIRYFHVQYRLSSKLNSGLGLICKSPSRRSSKASSHEPLPLNPAWITLYAHLQLEHVRLFWLLSSPFFVVVASNKRNILRNGRPFHSSHLLRICSNSVEIQRVLRT